MVGALYCKVKGSEKQHNILNSNCMLCVLSPSAWGALTDSTPQQTRQLCLCSCLCIAVQLCGNQNIFWTEWHYLVLAGFRSLQQWLSFKPISPVWRDSNWVNIQVLQCVENTSYLTKERASVFPCCSNHVDMVDLEHRNCLSCWLWYNPVPWRFEDKGCNHVRTGQKYWQPNHI